MTKQPDKFEKYLVGSLTTRRFCELIGFDEFIKNLVHGLNGLLMAHDRIVAREIKKLTLGLVRACQQGKIGKGKGITDVQIASLLGLSLKEIRILDDLRMATPLDPLDRVKELDCFQADLHLPNGKLSALRVARLFGLKLKQLGSCLHCSDPEIRTKPDADKLQRGFPNSSRLTVGFGKMGLWNPSKSIA